MEGEVTGFSELVFDVLTEYSGCILSKETTEALLKAEENITWEEKVQICSNKRSSSSVSVGYPQYPLCFKLSKVLNNWMIQGKSVLANGKNNLGLLQENLNKRDKVMDLVDFKLKFLQESWNIIAIPEKKRRILEILETLQLRGILDLLGMQQTVGSVDIFPPPVSSLWKSFRDQHKPNTKLSCGARALSKHCHRDSTSQWWGVSTGSEHDKNEHADKILGQILGDVVWINIHMLPHDVKILEVRNHLGYGARWSFDGKMFRGFLEPQIPDGHNIGWKH